MNNKYMYAYKQAYLVTEANTCKQIHTGCFIHFDIHACEKKKKYTKIRERDSRYIEYGQNDRKVDSRAKR